MSDDFKVLIIGGGLGGLALAQALRKHGIAYEIFERDLAWDSRNQGWALSLHWILEDLLGQTPDDMPSFDHVSLGYEHGMEAEFAYFNAFTGEEQMRLSHSKEKPFLRSDRSKVRLWLMHKLDIQWNKHFIRYTEDSDGVTAYFEDGTSAKGSLLVGADGVNSKVRDQLMVGSGLKPRIIPLGNITSLVELPKEKYTKQLELGRSFFLAHSPNHRLFVGFRHFSKDEETASFYWRLSWYDKETQNEPYWTATASPEELMEYAREKTKDFFPLLTETLRATPPSGVVVPSLTFWDMLPIPLPTGRVTLLGDGIHPMSPFRGEGANFAMKDGLSLGQYLAERKNGETIPELLKRYESEMLIRGSGGVLKSRAAAEDHVKESDEADKRHNGDNSWLTARIKKQAGDQGFKRVVKD
ncbi:hypothetical protein LTR84_006317 [Exophiala bonariae]|uniref:FAD-binding domain-containing protein n=1 Tax=Exophiala bonariae TaxID=1690606 RepID=A0AAV9N175_9EURO|nr:hypothetical protein LTR84_006317 [Exophiala bonariae]